MIKKRTEQYSSLFPEKPSYPWQVVEADGETWLIMRQKEKVAPQPLSKVSGVSLENFSWELVNDTKEGCFYSGEIALRVSFQELDITQEEYEIKEPWQDEYLFNKKAFAVDNEIPFKFKQDESRIQETAFATLLFDGSELSRHLNVSLGNKTWDVSLPWRCWLRGSGINKQPIIKKVHVAQVGFFTLLLEALIKLEKEQEPDLAEEEKGQTTVIAEKTVLQIDEDFISEIIGLSIKRDWGQCFYDVPSETLKLQYLKKFFLVYISSYHGGERLSIASGLREELLRTKSKGGPLYPVGVELRSKQVRIGLIGENKVFNHSKSFCTVRSDFGEEKEKTLTDSKPKLGKKEIPLPPLRKWLGKNG